jgi:hypothetical protein
MPEHPTNTPACLEFSFQRLAACTVPRALPDHVELRDRGESLKFREWEHVGVEKVDQLFRDNAPRLHWPVSGIPAGQFAMFPDEALLWAF